MKIYPAKIPFVVLISLTATFAVSAQTLQAQTQRARRVPKTTQSQREAQQQAAQMQPTDSVLLPGIYWEHDRAPLKIGETAPDFSLPLARDSRWKAATNKQAQSAHIEYSNEEKTPQIALDELVQNNRNGVTVVVFWAFWCDTWKDVSAYFVRMKPKLQGEHVQIVCVAVDASQQPVARRAFTNGTLWYPVAIDNGSATTANWGVRRVPTLFVLDNQRRIRHVFEGFAGERALLKAIHEARKPLKESARVSAQG